MVLDGPGWGSRSVARTCALAATSVHAKHHASWAGSTRSAKRHLWLGLRIACLQNRYRFVVVGARALGRSGAQALVVSHDDSAVWMEMPLDVVMNHTVA